MLVLLRLFAFRHCQICLCWLFAPTNNRTWEKCCWNIWAINRWMLCGLYASWILMSSAGHCFYRKVLYPSQAFFGASSRLYFISFLFPCSIADLESEPGLFLSNKEVHISFLFFIIEIRVFLRFCLSWVSFKITSFTESIFRGWNDGEEVQGKATSFNCRSVQISFQWYASFREWRKNVCKLAVV